MAVKRNAVKFKFFENYDHLEEEMDQTYATVAIIDAKHPQVEISEAFKQEQQMTTELRVQMWELCNSFQKNQLETKQEPANRAQLEQNEVARCIHVKAFLLTHLQVQVKNGYACEKMSSWNKLMQ